MLLRSVKLASFACLDGIIWDFPGCRCPRWLQIFNKNRFIQTISINNYFENTPPPDPIPIPPAEIGVESKTDVVGIDGGSAGGSPVSPPSTTTGDARVEPRFIPGIGDRFNSCPGFVRSSVGKAQTFRKKRRQQQKELESICERRSEGIVLLLYKDRHISWFLG